MPTYQKCDGSVAELAREILCEFPTHKPILDARVQIDYIFAFPDYDDMGMAKNDAIRHHGCKALGLARRLKLKDRVMGRGDCEVLLDGHWWKEASRDERRAILDHELHHFIVKQSTHGVFERDDIGRPKIVLRHHDFEFGWFAVIAERHGLASQERQQAKIMMEQGGQFFWPEVASLKG